MTRCLVQVVGLTFLLLMAASASNVVDPFIRYDDYPALFGDEELFFIKTLTEGRWMNYWWIARPFLWASETNYFLYQLAWATFCAAVAINAFGRDMGVPGLAAIAALVAFSPQAFMIGGWFNTLVLGHWFIALFAVACLYLSRTAQRLLFLATAPVSMLAYSTYPFLMIVLCLTRKGDRRSLKDLGIVLGLLGASLLIGMALMYSINYWAHGEFDIVIGQTRETAPVHGFSELVVNATNLIPGFFERFHFANGFGIPAISGLILVTVLAAILHLRRDWLSAYITAAAFSFVAILLVHSIKEGVEVPARALIALWVLMVILISHAALLGLPARARPALALLSVMLFGTLIFQSHAERQAWQRATQNLATHVPSETETLLLHGDFAKIEGYSTIEIMHPLALVFRLEQLTRADAIDCERSDDPRCNGSEGFQLKL